MLLVQLAPAAAAAARRAERHHGGPHFHASVKSSEVDGYDDCPSHQQLENQRLLLKCLEVKVARKSGTGGAWSNRSLASFRSLGFYLSV
jgi:hypothetical protein